MENEKPWFHQNIHIIKGCINLLGDIKKKKSLRNDMVDFKSFKRCLTWLGLKSMKL